MALTVDQIESAISRILSGGQAITVEGETYTRANLTELWKLREKVKAEADAEAGAYSPRTSAAQGGRG